MLTKSLYSNCHFGLVYLLLRGVAEEVIFVPGGNWLIPWHVGIVTYKRHYISFYRLLPHEQNTFGAWWFLGSFKGIGRSKWLNELIKRGRIRRMRPKYVLIIYIISYCALFCPWCLAWFCFGPFWSLSWSWQAMQKRIVSVKKYKIR